MSESTVSKKIKKLPPEAKQQAQDFVDFLYERYVKDGTKKSGKKSILESSFFGMWKDREDMQDSTAWVRKVRKSQWSNP
jgi:mRNA-degrading endonuclease RelE of RelBE toxin-antitoxin system